MATNLSMEIRQIYNADGIKETFKDLNPFDLLNSNNQSKLKGSLIQSQIRDTGSIFLCIRF